MSRTDALPRHPALCVASLKGRREKVEDHRLVVAPTAVDHDLDVTAGSRDAHEVDSHAPLRRLDLDGHLAPFGLRKGRPANNEQAAGQQVTESAQQPRCTCSAPALTSIGRIPIALAPPPALLPSQPARTAAGAPPLATSNASDR